MTEQQIIDKVAELKKQHDVSQIKVVHIIPTDKEGLPDASRGKYVFLRPVTRQALSAAMATGDKIAQAVSLFNSSWLEGDKTMLDDMDYFPGLLEGSMTLIPETVTTVKNY